jgi:phage N-6-adenine-methyltransferase
MTDTRQPPSWWNNDHWATPPAFVAELAHRFGKFDLDACAKAKTAKAPRYYGIAENGLRSPWNGVTFFNPPQSEMLLWVRRAKMQVARDICPLAVGLLPASVATNWFHKYVLPYAEIHFVRGRIAFLDWNLEPASATRGEHFVAVWRPGLQATIYNSIVFEANP